MFARFALVFTLLGSLSAAAAESEVSQYTEMSYLVFPKAQGFDRPVFTSDVLAGTLTVRFKDLPAGWRGLLEAQLTNERKRQFFAGFQPLVEGGRTTGLIVDIGVPGFDVEAYPKSDPRRWVIRVGKHRAVPVGAGALAVPVVPYADLLDPDLEGRDDFAAAERALARGDANACERLEHLRTTGSGELAAFAAIRHADCLAGKGDLIGAVATLAAIKGNRISAPATLARIRAAEFTGRALSSRDALDAYVFPMNDPSLAGAVADEAALRQVRVFFWRGDYGRALEALAAFAKARPESPYAPTPALEEGLRRRVVMDSAHAGQWLVAARAYVAGPPAREMSPARALYDWVGARALREIGLPKEASRIYLGLLRSSGGQMEVAVGGPSGDANEARPNRTGFTELEVLLALASTYAEDKDTTRADVTLRYVDEKWRDPTSRREVARLRAELALAKHNARAAVVAVEAMRPGAGERGAAAAFGSTEDHASLGSAATDGDRAVRTDSVIARTAVAALDAEGVVAARRVLAPQTALARAQGLASEVARDLAAAAGDCDALLVRTSPIELATGDDLLLSSACLLSEGRVEEALVLVDAANVWAAGDLVRPDLDMLVSIVRAQAMWWLNRGRAIAQGENRT